MWNFILFSPLIKTAGHDQAASLLECSPEGGLLIHSLRSGIDGSDSNLWISCQRRDQPPLRIEKLPLIAISNAKNRLCRGDIVPGTPVASELAQNRKDLSNIMRAGKQIEATAHSRFSRHGDKFGDIEQH